jgi:O-antigen biosynthesis protein
MLKERVRSVLVEATGGDPRGYRRFRARVEPNLTNAPRVHRFARAPILGAPETPAEPVAVCLVPGRGEPRAPHSLSHQTRAPADVVGATPAEALSATRAPWVVFVDSGDRLAPVAVELLGQAARLAPDSAVITCDEDDWMLLGRAHPRLRPGPSPDLLLEHDIAGGLLCVRRDRVEEVPEGPAWQYDLALRLAGPDGAGQAHVPAILRHSGPRHEDPATHLSVAARLLEASDPAARMERLSAGKRRVRRPLSGEPSVEIVILFRDGADLLRRCVESVLAETRYENFGIRLVDNASESAETRELVGRLRRDRRVTATRDDRPFNFAGLNNVAAAGSDAEFLCFLNNDTEVITSSWLDELLEHAQRPQVGAVAPMLLFGDGRVQHVGAALGMHGYAGHPFAGLGPGEPTPFGSATDGTRNWLAVTAACMLVERRKFKQVRGFDESFVVAGNDVDLCLRLTGAGYRSICVPQVTLLHHEGRSRGGHIDPGDFASSERSYGEFRTVGDPFYNPNLTLRTSDCRLRSPEEL